MRTVTMKELDAMLDAVRFVQEASVGLSQMCTAVHTVSWGMLMDNPVGALAVGVKGSEAILEERSRMFRQFEIAAFNFLGESRRPGETPEGYFERVSAMSEAELLATLVRNGLKLRL